VDVDARLEAVENENEILRSRIRELEAQLNKVDVVPMSFGLTAHEAKVFITLFNSGICSKEFLLNSVYEGAYDQPQLKIIDVFICKMRKKMKAFGVEIQTVWGRGYRMTPEMKEAATKFA